MRKIFNQLFGYKLWLYSNETFFTIRIDRSNLEYIRSLTEKYEPCELDKIYNGFIRKITLSTVRDRIKDLCSDRSIRRLSEFIDNTDEHIYWSV